MYRFVITLLLVLLTGCSGDEPTDAGSAATAADAAPAVSQAATMEEIWASDLDPAEKARRVQELLAKSGPAN